MSNEITIEQMNEAICDFMGGYRKIERSDYHINVYKGPDGIEWETGTYLKYHSSWDWLMPVVEKCRKVSRGKQHEFSDNSSSIQDPLSWKSWSYRYIDLSTNIKEVHEKAYQFIQWYNKQQSNEQA